MKRNLQPIALFVVIMVVAMATVFVTYVRPTPLPPALPRPDGTSTTAPMFTYLVDVAGWYEITPNERAVAGPIDLSIDGLKALPTTLGHWLGEPYALGPDVDEWFENPDVALSNLYHDDQGHQAWFSTFGSRSRKSYFLFEHTPITSYPAAGWDLVEHDVLPIMLGSNRIYVQKATFTKDKERRIVLFWYLWSDFNRDPEQGVLTMRLHIPVISTDEDAVSAGADFLRSLFPQVISWHRF